MPTLTIECDVPLGATVRVYDKHDNEFVGESISDGSGILSVSTDYDAIGDFIFIVASESPDVNIDVSPTKITIT